MTFQNQNQEISNSRQTSVIGHQLKTFHEDQTFFLCVLCGSFFLSFGFRKLVGIGPTYVRSVRRARILSRGPEFGLGVSRTSQMNGLAKRLIAK
jgi:hypothetical protein